jgi:hypothetical protein
MSGVRGAFAALVCGACGAAASNATPGATATAVDPASCVDRDPAQEWRAELDRRIDALLPSLASCATSLTKPGLMHVGFRFGDDSKADVHVLQSNIDDCRIASCVKQRLAPLESPLPRPGPDDAVPSDTLVELFPAAAARRAERERLGELREAKHCVDPLLSPSHDLGSARLPPAQIQSIVRSRYGSIRRCYEEGLKRDAHLTGRITVRFVIDREGQVSKAIVSASTVPDCTASACVRDQFKLMKFPVPEHGILTVVYPIMLEPG